MTDTYGGCSIRKIFKNVKKRGTVDYAYTSSH